MFFFSVVFFLSPAGLSVDMRSGLKEMPNGLSVIDNRGATVDLRDLRFEEQVSPHHPQAPYWPDSHIASTLIPNL